MLKQALSIDRLVYIQCEVDIHWFLARIPQHSSFFSSQCRLHDPAEHGIGVAQHLSAGAVGTGRNTALILVIHAAVVYPIVELTWIVVVRQGKPTDERK